MRILLVALLLSGCSMADLKGNPVVVNHEEEQGNRRIVLVEQECAQNGLVINTPAYDRCITEELKDEPKLMALLAKLKAQYAQRAANGQLAADSQCTSLGYRRGTTEYEICLDYARENNIGGPPNVNSRASR